MVSPKEKPGRTCPRHYRYAASVFAREPTFEAESIYVAGGLYGNVHALEAVLALARSDGATLAFNGAVLQHVALRGNVETEIAGEDTGAGCGCGYPEWVGDPEVDRSNEILRRLRETARGFPDLRARLGALPMHLVAEVGGVRIGIVHGDAESLAGWEFSQEAMRARPERAQALLAGAGVGVFACSHTCLPVMQGFALPRGAALVANNGAAGMPNFRGTRFGLATRIALRSSPDALYRARIGMPAAPL